MIQVLRLLSAPLKEKKLYFIGSIFCALVMAIIKLEQARLVRPIFDQGLSAKTSREELIKLCLWLLFLALINIFFRFYHFYLIRRTVLDCSADLRLRLFNKLFRLNSSIFSKGKKGEFLSLVMNDIHVFMVGLHGVVESVKEPFMAACMLGYLFYLDVRLTLLILLIGPFFIVIFGLTGKKVKKYQRNVQEKLEDVTHDVGETVGGIKLVKSFNLQQILGEKFGQKLDSVFNSTYKAIKVEETAAPTVEFIGSIALAIIIVTAHQMMTRGAMSAGTFLSYIMALVFLMEPIRKFSRIIIKINQAIVSGERVQNFLNLEEEYQPQKLSQLNGFADHIKINNVYFSYDNNAVLTDINLMIEKGKKYAIVGPSGGGKTTLFNLLLGLVRPTKGMIQIDGIDYDRLTTESIRKTYSLVDQEQFIFHTTILKNLIFDNNVKMTLVDEVCRTSLCKEFIEKLPNGYQTIIGERGSRLSKGQIQRLTMARAMLKESDVFLFDEATSALDQENEKLFNEIFYNLVKDKTVIVIAHRAMGLNNFDQIIYMEDGMIKEIGKHDELYQMKGHFYNMFKDSLV